MEEKRYKALGILTSVVLVILACAVTYKCQQAHNGIGNTAKSGTLGREWSKLELILSQIQDNYVDSIDVSSFVEKTIPLIMQELDPHSIYLEPTELQSADEELQGNIEGIGVLFNVPDDTATVINVVVGGPAERMGLLSGDRIIKVDTQVIAGRQIPQDSMVRLMKGPKGSKVDISVLRFGEEDLITFPIIRDKIPVNTVDVAYMITPTVGYIKLSKFARTSHMEVLEALISLMEQNMKSLIFDIRDNSGGYLDQALKISSIFLDKGKLIVYTEGQHREREDYFNPTQGICANLPLAVLIDDGTASSSEIMAGALQDNDRGVIIGRRSYGKGLVQEPIYFSDKSGMRLTVSRFYTPVGRSIQKPYDGDREDYTYDILERYRNGELMQEDSIRKNDSLKYVTAGGKVLYGGGGIIPDVFVPLDTLGMNDCYVRISRLGLPIKFSISFADRHRAELGTIASIVDLDAFFEKYPVENEFLSYASHNDLKPTTAEWKECREIVMTQVKAYIGRNTKLEDRGFYPYVDRIDNVVQRAVQELEEN